MLPERRVPSAVFLRSTSQILIAIRDVDSTAAIAGAADKWRGLAPGGRDSRK
jgi:hypothetical protein